MQALAISRKQFLRGQPDGSLPLRPPWALNEQAFTDICTRCGECITHCHSHIIKKGSGGFPVIDFSQRGCDYCTACVSACKPGALQTQQQTAFPTSQTATIKHHCFSEQGIICRSCGEVCEFEAISFQLIVGGGAKVNLNNNLCDGCGECVHICPANAIEVKHVNIENPGHGEPV